MTMIQQRETSYVGESECIIYTANQLNCHSHDSVNGHVQHMSTVVKATAMYRSNTSTASKATCQSPRQADTGSMHASTKAQHPSHGHYMW